MQRARFLLLAAILAACGGIADPSLHTGQSVATVKGSLGGGAVAPGGARVALVWRNGQTGGVAVGADVALDGGSFSMSLDVPPDAYFFPVDPNGTSVNGSNPPSSGGTLPSPPSTGSSGSTGGTGGTSGGTTADAGVSGSHNVNPLGGPSGQVTDALTAAVAGFVVYADANGNDRLDLTGTEASSPDTILGGNNELYLVYLRGGGALDFEKLRDKSGILPAAGYNLAWTEGRWLALDLVELKLGGTTRLPSAVCNGSSNSSFDNGGPSSSGTSGGVPSVIGGGSNGYPSPTDPTLHCSADGRSFTSTPQCSAPPPLPPPGLCTNYDMPVATTCAGVAGGSLDPGIVPPPGWPCPVADIPSADAGTAQKDSSVPVTDAGVD